MGKGKGKGIFASSAWHGADFELSIEFANHSNTRLQKALVTLWSHPTLDGCYKRRKIDPWKQPRLDPADSDNLQKGELLGVATLPNGRQAACRSNVVIGNEEVADLLYFGVPMASLGYSYPVGAYPIDDGAPLDWRESINEWLRDIGEVIYANVKYRLGLVGHDVGGLLEADEFEVDGIPDQRWEGYLWPEGEELMWFPPNMGAPMTFNTRIS